MSDNSPMFWGLILCGVCIVLVPVIILIGFAETKKNEEK